MSGTRVACRPDGLETCRFPLCHEQQKARLAEASRAFVWLHVVVLLVFDEVGVET